jgi:hypothetical protein
MSSDRRAIRGEAKSFGRNSIIHKIGIIARLRKGGRWGAQPVACSPTAQRRIWHGNLPNTPIRPGFAAQYAAHWCMDRTLNVAIGVVILAGAFAVALAILVW